MENFAKHHPIVWERSIAGLNVIRIEPAVKIQVYKSGKDMGYHGYTNFWWTNPNCPYAFQYLDIDTMYIGSYYESKNTGHPTNQMAEDLYKYMQEIYKNLFGENFKSILELGTGGGEITYQFIKNGIDTVAVEGTTEGVGRLRKLGILEENIIHSNLKFLKPMNKRFDLVMCTEVAEHIEPWFASKIVENCTAHSDVIWFSAADYNRPAHYHHINEIDIEAWDNIFAHMGFPILIHLDKRYSRADRLYLASSMEKLIK